jgi:RTX calcium-binding nonapeptide repeat (4 copies)
MTARWRLLIPLFCFAIVLALPAGAGAKVENVTLTPLPGTNLNALTITGSSGSDEITLSIYQKPNPPFGEFLQIEDPGGVGVVPPGCFRRDANTIHCPVELFPSPGTDESQDVDIFAGGGNDRVTNTTNYWTRVDGLFGADVLDGQGNDVLIGGAGNDRLFGQAGKDTLLGGPGNDRINGGGGNDIVDCGPGKHDIGIGGPGKDLGRRCETVKH